MTVRSFDAVDDTIALGGPTGSVGTHTLLALVKPSGIGTSDKPIFSVGAVANGGVGSSMYFKPSGQLCWGSDTGDSTTTVVTCNNTDWWLLGITKSTGLTARIHAKNLTTNAATVHGDGGGSSGDNTTSWTTTYINRWNNSAIYLGQKIAVAAVIKSALSDTDFDDIVAARSTASIIALAGGSDRVWDFTQNPVSNDVFNLVTNTDDQASIVGTFFTSNDDPPRWTFGIDSTHQGPIIAGGGASVAGGAGPSWTNPGNVILDDNTSATCVIPLDTISKWLVSTNFGFNIPSTATITGIEFQIARSSTGTGTVDNAIVPTKDGTTSVGTPTTNNQGYPTVEQVVTYGGPTSLWGTTWTPAEINSPQFGVIFQVYNGGGTSRTVSVDWSSATVYYEDGQTTPTLADYDESNWADNQSTSEVTGSIAWQTDDLILVLGATGDNGRTLGTPTASGLTFAAVPGFPTNTASAVKIYAWTARAASNGSGTITSTTDGASGARGLSAWVWRGSDGIGQTNVAPSNGTTSVAELEPTNHSAVVFGAWDWAAVNDTTVTWTPFDVVKHTVREASWLTGQWTAFVSEWLDQPTGPTDYGFTAGTGTAYGVTAIEVLGAAGEPPPSGPDIDDGPATAGFFDPQLLSLGWF